MVPGHFSCFFMILGWFFMVPGWFSWFRVGFHDSGLVFKVFHGFMLVFCGSRSVFIVFHGSRLVFHGFPWFQVGFSWVFLQNVPARNVSWPDDLI